MIMLATPRYGDCCDKHDDDSDDNDDNADNDDNDYLFGLCLHGLSSASETQ